MAIFDTVNCSASVRLHMPAHSSGASHAVTKTVKKLRRTLLRRKDKQDMHALAQPVSSITATSTADQIAQGNGHAGQNSRGGKRLGCWSSVDAAIAVDTHAKAACIAELKDLNTTDVLPLG